MSRSAARRIEHQAFFLLKSVNRAIRDYNMIHDGDRIAVAVSGGKDSLSLLYLLNARRRRAPERYELVAIHIRGDARGPSPPHTPLEDWLARSGIPFVAEDFELPADEPLPMNCQRCTWNRRKQLFLAADRLGCNVVALGHHADDLAETALLNLFRHGRVDGMAPCAEYFGGRLRLIRPLIYVWEKELRCFARALELPPPPPVCPRSQNTLREKAAALLHLADLDFPHARLHLCRIALRAALRSSELSDMRSCWAEGVHQPTPEPLRGRDASA
ncbi:MAG: tRNA 2-thiocytidine biosynthesis TtcA family protein [Anaerolineae bacterium]|nr:tRNA 2-thiocytidine biosynthesis TtcA family protein [Anaerolineae bacterium]MDW8099817.1 tRNA 2-thiocytidine biosynthesis TtcA family protein [Anaerolineae bacterium]